MHARRLLKQVRNKGEVCRHVLAADRHDLVVAISAKSTPRPINSEGIVRRPAPRTHATMKRCGMEFARSMRQPTANWDKSFKVGRCECCFDWIRRIEGLFPTLGLGELLLRQLGYQVSPPPGKVSLRRSASPQRLLPQWLRIALSKRLSQKPRRSWPTSFVTTPTGRAQRVFALPTFYKTFFCINLRGREPQGIVEPGKDYLDLLNRLELDLPRPDQPRTGTSPISRIDRTMDLFGGQPPPMSGPSGGMERAAFPVAADSSAM